MHQRCQTGFNRKTVPPPVTLHAADMARWNVLHYEAALYISMVSVFSSGWVFSSGSSSPVMC